LPDGYSGDGASLLPILVGNAKARIKDWIYIWYKGRVIVRNRTYALLAKADGGEAVFRKYRGPFAPEELQDDALSESEKSIKAGFEATRARLAKTRGVKTHAPAKKK
jgi:hypothetical protein